jgi:hypothetical protein
MGKNAHGGLETGIRRIETEGLSSIVRNGPQIDDTLEAGGAAELGTEVEKGLADAPGIVPNARIEAVGSGPREIEVGKYNNEVVVIPVGSDELPGHTHPGLEIGDSVRGESVVKGPIVLEDRHVPLVVEEPWAAVLSLQ